MSKRSKALRYYRSYKPQSPLKKAGLSILRIIVVVFILFQIVHTFFVQVYIEDSKEGGSEHLIASPLLYGPEISLIDYRFPPVNIPERGDLVAVEFNMPEESPWYETIVNSLSRFFTFNRIELFNEKEPSYGSRYQIFRVVGIPGDTVRLENYQVKIKSSDRGFFLDESIIVPKEYNIELPEKNDSVAPNLPFSGNHPELVLTEDEYLLVPDDRSKLAPSSRWKATGMSMIRAKVLVSFWPRFTVF